MKSYIDVSAIDVEFIIKVIGLTLVSWLPLHIVKLVIEKMDPSIDAKIMKRAKVFTKQEEEGQGDIAAMEAEAKKQ